METVVDLGYNPKNIDSILDYARKLIGKTLRDSTDAPDTLQNALANEVKGKFGQYLEKYYFGIENNSESKPDFEAVGLELKTNPLKKLRKGKISAKERVVLNIIDYMNIINEEWDKSHLLSKNEFILFVMYLYENDKNFLDYIIKYVKPWKIEGEDREIIRQDWEKIVKKIRDGKAHELSEGDTFYLGACRKGWKEGLKKQPNSEIGAPQRAFSFKINYVNSILNRIQDSETLVKNVSDIKTNDFDKIVLKKFDDYLNLSIEEIEKKLNIHINQNAKGYYALLARRMLGVSAKKITEFEKAEVTMKIIRLKHNGVPKEDMSFPSFKYENIFRQDWEESDFYNQLEKKFLIIVYQMNKDESKIIFKKAFFWNIPFKDLQEAKSVWIKTKITIEQKKSEGYPKKSENKVAHVRPHGRNKADTISTPWGSRLEKKCFWLNSGYLKEQIENN